ncbi:MAG: efflux RND transporter periplasmic adaptor subunit [Melioribacteraceae bacterium]|nr:efflux RND transporter periplasmic adaptor subunit [Melioribacteraceae bacterium]
MKLLFNTVIVILIVFLGSCREEPETEAVENVVLVDVTKAAVKQVSVPLRATGKLSASKESSLSFKIPGIIESIHIKQGQSVKEGDVLASLKQDEIDANFSKARNGVEKAKRDYERIQNLYNEKVATLEQLQNMKTALDVAESDFKIARFNREYSVIKAPSDGKILRIISEENEITNAGYPVLLFGSAADRWKISTGISDIDIIKISIGDSALVNFDAYPENPFEARVIEVGQGADPRTGTYEVKLELTPTTEKLASGFIGKIKIIPSIKESLIVLPIEALVDAEGRRANVFVPDNDNHVKKTCVDIKALNDDVVYISGGLEDGQIVVSKSAEYLQEGSKIKTNQQ